MPTLYTAVNRQNQVILMFTMSIHIDIVNRLFYQ